VRFWKLYLVPTIVVMLLIGSIVWWNFFSEFKPNEILVRYANAQLAFSAVTIMGIVFTLLYATHQFRRSLAKPDIKLTFDETGATKKFMDLEEQQNKDLLIPIYAYNGGNKVASIYQIELKVPNVFESYLIRAQEDDRLDGKSIGDPNTFTVYFNSENKLAYTSFVDKYVAIGKLRLRKGSGAKLKSANRKITYTIFGDWPESQEGSLLFELREK